MKQIHFSCLFKVTTKMTYSLYYTVVSYSQHARRWTHNSISSDFRSSTNTELNVLSSASEYWIQSLLLPRKTTAPLATHTETSSFSSPCNLSPQNPKKVISMASKGKTEFLSLRCGVTEMTLTAQWDIQHSSGFTLVQKRWGSNSSVVV